MRLILMLGCALLWMSYSDSASALQIITGKVTQIEATYMPTQIPFLLSEGNATCPAGKPVYWAKEQENNKAIYAMLMSAFVSGKRVTLIMDDNDTSCTGKFIYMVD
ncbi:hypothetical protein [Xanthomonas rydalmerensis]|uniref:Uncharacterized protein n=1 Tax=Xanthomonas rydalmerensis TaxID=3046274 RepID=A0ABZ0JLZ8_9XANT|nr:hypothetical protein [Xanthomonas sp. DM-2023]WOS40853.1 hypothetical protein QN243_21120 [Xanthomonas sp. DM-2023]WOS45038.1 hypothetical protein QN242_21120 [Xanthomonas sp. DM-2023]WOS49217.1 hypothetical protein QN240_21120 [Xanthomonas sp. DM-2023]WOS53397.1 hypothetical protein QN244_21125 [Xanthomonas sp. DM-2023]WOS57580.1 hypothetical protein QN245_21120 [Xanthomonas sp. DM-2023]